MCNHLPYTPQTHPDSLKDKPRFPSFVGANAKDIITQLMTHDVTRRLGCMADGCEGIRNHYWFKGVDWAKVSSLKQVGAAF